MKNICKIMLMISIAGLYVSCVSFGTDMPPLYRAARNGNLTRVIHLVERGEDINATDRFRNTPLEVAAAQGHLEIVSYLLANNARDPERAFQRSVRNRHTDIIKYFINGNYIDINMDTNVLAFRQFFEDREETFEQRMQNIKFLTNGKMNSPNILRLISPEYYQDAVDFFDINLSDRIDILGNTILHVAARLNNVNLVKYLLENDFDVNLLDNNGHTALFYNITSFGSSINWAIPIIENETTARINYIGDPPFWSNPFGVRMRQAEISLLLLDAGINVNQQNNAGWTVLHFAGISNWPGRMELFIERGADQQLKTNFGRTASELFELRN